MADNFKLQIITPFGIEVTSEVTEVEVPSTNGEIGFLAGHVPYAGILDIGLLQYKTVSGENKKIVVKKGFCSYLNGSLTILADSVRTTKASNEEISKKAELSGKLATTQDKLEWNNVANSLKEIEASEGL